MSENQELYWQIYKKGTYDALGHKVGIIPQGFKTPTYSMVLEVFKGTQAEAMKRADMLERELNIL